MITEHVMSPALAQYQRTINRATFIAVVVMVAAYVWHRVVVRRAARQLVVDRQREADEARALDQVAAVEDFVASIAGDRGRCACAEGSTSCGAPRCILCHRCGKVARLVNRPTAEPIPGPGFLRNGFANAKPPGGGA